MSESEQTIEFVKTMDCDVATMADIYAMWRDLELNVPEDFGFLINSIAKTDALNVRGNSPADKVRGLTSGTPLNKEIRRQLATVLRNFKLKTGNDFVITPKGLYKIVDK